MAYISIGLYSFLNRVSMRIEWRGGQAKGKESQKRGVKAPPTNVCPSVMLEGDDYGLKVSINIEMRSSNT